MPLQLSHTIYPNYLEVVIKGIRTPGNEFEEAIEMWSKIFSISNRENLDNILAHLHIIGRLPVHARINISQAAKNVGCSLAHRIALIAHNDELYINLQTIITLTQAAGYNLLIFERTSKARKWLLQEHQKKGLKDQLFG